MARSLNKEDGDMNPKQLELFPSVGLIPKMDTPESKKLWEFIIRTKEEVSKEIPQWRIEQEMLREERCKK
jgi:hypothetical protein